MNPMCLELPVSRLSNGRRMITEAAKTVAIRIDDGLIVTMDRERRIIEAGCIVVDEGRIVDLGKTERLRNRYPAQKVINARHKVVLPGLINAHAHTTAEFATRGFVPDGLRIFEWLEWMVPLYEVMSAEQEFVASKLAFVECIKSGTTCFLGSGTEKCIESVARAAQEVGIRAVISDTAMDVPGGPRAWYRSTEDTLKGVKETHHKYHGRSDGRLNIWAIPLQPTFVTKELLIELKKFVDREGTGLCMHSNYDPAEVDFCLKQTGKRPIEYLESIGVLDKNLVLVHVVYVSDAELELLIKHDVKIVHCPTTALRLAYGVTRHGRFPEMLREGLTVSLGCDGVNGGSSFDLVRAMYLAAGLYKDCRVDATLIPAETALEMGTINGAKTLQMEDKLGSIEKGKMADIILLDRKRPEWNPLFNVVNTLVYSATGDSVDTVLVNGNIVMEHRRMTTVNEDEIYEQIQKVGENMVQSSGLKLKTRWPTI